MQLPRRRRARWPNDRGNDWLNDCGIDRPTSGESADPYVMHSPPHGGSSGPVTTGGQRALRGAARLPLPDRAGLPEAQHRIPAVKIGPRGSRIGPRAEEIAVDDLVKAAQIYV